MKIDWDQYIYLTAQCKHAGPQVLTAVNVFQAVHLVSWGYCSLLLKLSYIWARSIMAGCAWQTSTSSTMTTSPLQSASIG